MPRYLFNVFEGGQCVKDKSGCELSGIDEVNRELKRLVMMLPDSMQRAGVRICVVDEQGKPFAEEWLQSAARRDAS